MVDLQDKEVVIFDLDGTLLRVNSFKVWLLYWGLLPWVKPGFSLALYRILWLRLRRRIDRVAMKNAVMQAFERHRKSGKGVAERLFIRLLWLLRRRGVVDRAYAEDAAGKHVVLATAAPECYAAPLVERLGLKYLVASTVSGGRMRETIGEEKRQAVLELLHQQQWRTESLTVLWTDHKDDLPLAALVQKIILVKPAPSSLRAFTEAGMAVSQWRGPLSPLV